MSSLKWYFMNSVVRKIIYSRDHATVNDLLTSSHAAVQVVLALDIVIILPSMRT